MAKKGLTTFAIWLVLVGGLAHALAGLNVYDVLGLFGSYATIAQTVIGVATVWIAFKLLKK